VFTIIVTPSPLLPTITGTGPLSSLNTIYGTASSAGSFTVSGTNLTEDVLVSPPPGFEASTDNVNFKTSVTVIAGTSIYIRLAATTAAGTYSGNIKLTSGGASNVSVPIANSVVSPAPLIITADDKTRSYGIQNPVLTVTYSGFVNNEGPAQLTNKPIIATTANSLSPLGKYPIIASGASSSNYMITYVGGTITVTKAIPAIVIPNTFTPNADGINDIWAISGLDSYPQSTTQVFNRYGSLVFQSQGYPKAWDGTKNGALLPFGTYYYKIDLKNGTIFSGWVLILN
jgi:gliding motility-associated-like protein